MVEKNLLIISNSFPDQEDVFIGNVFVKEQIKYLRHFFTNVYVVSPVAYGMERLRKTEHFDYQFDNVKVFFPKYFNNPFFWYYMRSLWVTLETRAIQTLIEKEQLSFDFIHAHMTWPSGAVAIKLKRRYNTPVIITEHTSKTFQTAVTTHDLLWKTVLNSADAVIRIRNGDCSLIETLNVSKEKIYAIPNGFDPEIFYPVPISECRKILGLPDDKKIILCIGNLYDRVKGHNFLVDASSEIIKKRQDILVIILGSGHLKPEIEKQIHLLGIENFVKLAGSKPHCEIPLWINACDLFVLPSLNEGNPTVMFEALGCGKPFIGTRVGGIPEVITSNDYGLLVEPADSEDLKKKILSALDRSWDREKILAYAEQFTWENIAKNIVSVYKQVLK